jgi:hypothetical protein
LITDADDKEHQVVNLIYSNHKLQAYDSNMKKLTCIANVEISKELDSNILDYDESLINLLLTLSPSKIVIHVCNIDENDKEALSTVDVVKKIFEDKIQICNGCKFCNN